MKNEGPIERGIQATISVVLMSVAIFWLDGAWSWLAGLAAVAIMAFAIAGFCPLYALLKINRYKNEK